MDDKKEFFSGILNIMGTDETSEQKRKSLEMVREEIFKRIAKSFGYDVWVTNDKIMVVGPDRALVRDQVLTAKKQIGGFYTTAKIVSSDESTI